MSPSPDRFSQIAKSDDIPEGQSLPFKVGDFRVVLVRHQGTLYALEDRCPHADATLAFGLVGNDCLACPWHFAEFQLETGEVVSGPATENIATYSVRESGGIVEIQVPPTGNTAESDS